MRDDRAGRIHHAHEFVDDAIRRDRRLGRVQLRLPLRQPGFALGRDLLRRRAVQQASAEPILHRIRQRRQRQLRIAEQRHLGRVALVQVARVVGGVDDAHARGQRRRGQRMAVQPGADRQDQIRARIEEMRAVPGEAVAAGTERQRVVLGERALAVHRRHHRALQQLRKLHQFVAGLGVEHALAGEDHRARCIDQQTRGLLHVMRVGCGARRAHRPVVKRIAADVEFQHIARQLHHHRSRAPVLQLTERATHRRRHLFRHQNVLGLLGDRGIGATGMEHRKHLRLLARMSERQEQHRH